ncbi:MAG: ATP-binding cassette domain-containing protein [Eubacteriales bacterium]
MLSLKGIVKSYVTGDTTVTALKGIDLEFRKSEFVSILGPSGCGKTTLLNLIGGLDRYDSGNLIIKGKSTHNFTDRDWDSYRNHSIGFIFQSYNLIPHQSVLANVELALTLSGVSKAERRSRAIAALEKVGLADQIHKRPNQMSGGQMQRVAIARALVNDPEIILADEPTGALDSTTSVQIMEILKSISNEKLIIMVTHNPDLAETYSSRIIRLSDGQVVSDSNPYTPEETNEAPVPAESKKTKPAKESKNRTSMSFLTALSLSMNNLLTKKGRTFLTSFAGSIGIIGIALILSLSNGIQLYINRVQEDTLSSYPITLSDQTVDYTSMVSAMMGTTSAIGDHSLDAIYSNSVMFDMMNVMLSEMKTNNLSAFKSYLDSIEADLNDQNLINDIQYGYDLNLSIYDPNTDEGITPLGMYVFYELLYGNMADQMASMQPGSSMNIFTEMIDNEELIGSQYDILAGRMPDSYDELVLVVNKNNEVSDMALYALGLKDRDELMKIMEAAMKGETFEVTPTTFTYDQILSTTFQLILPSDYYVKNGNGTWKYIGDDDLAMKSVIDNGTTLKIVGILRPSEDAVSSSINGTIGYTSALTREIINRTNASDLIREQAENPDTDILTGLPFPTENEPVHDTAYKINAVRQYMSGLSSMERADLYKKIVTSESITKHSLSSLPVDAMRGILMSSGSEQTATVPSMSDDEVRQMFGQYLDYIVKMSVQAAEATLGSMTNDQMAEGLNEYLESTDEELLVLIYDNFMPTEVSKSSYEENMTAFGLLDLDKPSSISIYPKDFDAKESLTSIIEEYNESVDDADKIAYTDYMELMMSSVSTIINFVSYALIAFVSISLVVSAIMIGIITYISVLERTKEIGILRAIGASKRDISRVFNAETFIVGLAAGIIGILVSLILCIPINLIIKSLADVNNIAVLPVAGAIILIAISVILTLVAGLVPSRMAAKKDPVIALRTE